MRENVSQKLVGMTPLTPRVAAYEVVVVGGAAINRLYRDARSRLPVDISVQADHILAFTGRIQRNKRIRVP